jgi:hypothetical protein
MFSIYHRREDRERRERREERKRGEREERGKRERKRERGESERRREIEERGEREKREIEERERWDTSDRTADDIAASSLAFSVFMSETVFLFTSLSPFSPLSFKCIHI